MEKQQIWQEPSSNKKDYDGLSLSRQKMSSRTIGAADGYSSSEDTHQQCLLIATFADKEITATCRVGMWEMLKAGPHFTIYMYYKNT